MIRGMHAMFYSDQAEATRAFIRDKLGLPGTDTGGGWWIFDLPEGDLGVHPSDHPGSDLSGTHDVSFYCDDLEAEVAAMRGRGLEFDDEISDRGYGLVIHFTMPGGIKCQLYQPKYK